MDITIDYETLCRISLLAHDRFTRESPHASLVRRSRGSLPFATIGRIVEKRARYVQRHVWQHWYAHVGFRDAVHRFLLRLRPVLPECVVLQIVDGYLRPDSYLPRSLRAAHADAGLSCGPS